MPILSDSRTFQVNGVVIKTWGAHNTKVGASFIWREFDRGQSEEGLGEFDFDPRLTDDGAGFGGNAVASLLLGFPSVSSRSATLFTPTFTTREPSAFLQDAWRVRDWLTLNLGLRYDVFTPFTEEEDRIANFDIPTASLILAGQNGISREAGIATDFGNVAPRIGASMTLPSDMVLRSGFGLSYFPGNLSGNARLRNPPFTSSFGPVISDGTTGGPPSLALSDGFPLPEPSSAENPTGSIGAVSRNFRSTRVQQFNVILEKELGGNVLGIGYVGSRVDRVVGNPDINLAPGSLPDNRC